jgi:hypothetical protein
MRRATNGGKGGGDEWRATDSGKGGRPGAGTAGEAGAFTVAWPCARQLQCSKPRNPPGNPSRKRVRHGQPRTGRARWL